MISKLIKEGDLFELKQYLKTSFNKFTKWNTYDAVYSLEPKMIDFVFSKSKERNLTGDVYFFIIDNADVNINVKIKCAEILLKYYPTFTKSSVIDEMNRRESVKNEKRVGVLLNTLNDDVCFIIKSFLK